MTDREIRILIDGGIDAQAALSRLMGKEKIYLKYLYRFAEDKNCVLFLEAVRNQDAEAAFRAVHTLKGTAAGIGAVCVSETADRLTEYLRPIRSLDPDLTAVLPEAKRLQEEISEACRAVERLKNLKAAESSGQ